MNNQFKTTAIYRGVIHLALLSASGMALAQAQTDKAPATLDTVVVKGQRAALQSAQKIKQEAEEIVDVVEAEEAGKLPDKSITEVLQRVVGVTVERQRSIDNDAERISERGSGIRVRGLSWGSSNLNGREVFSAGWPGRDLSWSAVPAELMIGVDTYKNPSAAQIEGGVSGLVNLRTALPFDYGTTKSYVSFGSNYVESSKKFSPAVSGLYSTIWDTDMGRVGLLVDVAVNNSTYDSENQQVGNYFPRTDIVAGKTVWMPAGANWGQNVGTSDRKGFYGALQWKKNDKQSALTYFVSRSNEQDTGSSVYPNFSDGNAGVSIYNVQVKDEVIDDRGVLIGGTYSYPFSRRQLFNADGSPVLTNGQPTYDYSLSGKGANQFAFGGLPMGTSRAFNQHVADTKELAWNFKWAVNNRLALESDLQWVNSTFETKGNEIQLGTFIPDMRIDVPQGTGAVQIGFSDATREHLKNPGNYFWNVIQPKRLKGDADLYALKLDAKLAFDHPILRDLRVGYRAAHKTSVREVATFESDRGSTGWQSIAVPWHIRQTSTPGQPASASDGGSWQTSANFPYLSDPRFKDIGSTELFSFSNFYKGRVGSLPDVVFPTYDMMRDYPNAYNTLMHEVAYGLCAGDAAKFGMQPADIAKECDKHKNFNADLQYGRNPDKISNVSETTQAVYGTLRFGFDDWAVPVEGNVGVRAVHTKAVSHGYIAFGPTYSATTPPHLPRFNPISEPLDVEDSHWDVMPTLNLKFDLLGNNKLLGRVAAARSIYRPGFQQLQESVSLSQQYDATNGTVKYSGSNSGNVKLRPLKADSFDLALEYYPRNGQSVTATLFYKDVKDIVYKGSYTRTYESVGGNPQVFTITGPRNAARAWVHGIELSGQTYLDHFDFLKDKLPDWAKGFGVSANYTYIGSSQKFYRDARVQYCPADATITSDAVRLYGCDTNGLPFGDQPLAGLTKNSANAALRYDRDGFSARLAYNWNSRHMTQIGGFGPSGGNGTSADPARAGARDTYWGLPVWQEAYGQLDGGVYYSPTPKLGLSLSVSNLNNVKVRETAEQTPGYMGTRWRFPGRSYYFSVRYEL
jgi:TonB-dependent receptor